MAIRALYEIKDAPLALIVDMYKKAMVPSIAEESFIRVSEVSLKPFFMRITH